MTTTCVDVNVRDSAVHEDNKRHSSVRPFCARFVLGAQAQAGAYHVVRTSSSLSDIVLMPSCNNGAVNASATS